MNSISAEACYTTVGQVIAEARSLSFRGNLTIENMSLLWHICYMISDSEEESNYGKPMVWIGIDIAVASLFCVLAMVSDLLHGFRNRKFWFPCKYFTLNATSITVITVAMKLPVDLNTPMNHRVDVIAKVGSLAFMSTMITNLMPSLASMDNKELLANATGLVILVITLIVNTSIELRTGLLHLNWLSEWFETGLLHPYVNEIWLWLGGLVCLLMLLFSTTISIPTIKQILEFKYQVAHKVASNDISQDTKSNVEKLRQHLRRYWVMARTSNPQFVMAVTPLFSAATVISVSVAVIYLMIASQIFIHRDYEFGSDYKWSMLVILVTQSIGIVVGNIAPLFRCFAALGFEVSVKWTISHLKVFKVENYWTQKLLAWKESRIASPSCSRLSKALVYNLKNLILWLCIGFQKIIVVSCKVIGLIPICFILVVYSLYHALSSILTTKTQCNMVQEPNHIDTDEDISNYVLQLQDEKKLAETTLKQISNSLNRLMQKAKKEHLPKNLIKLLQKSTGFEGVESFDSDEIEHLPSIELVSCWSLPVVTLTCIAITLPDVGEDIVECLINSVREGLSCTCLVDEGLKSSCNSVNIRKLITNLWDEVDVNCKWLDKTLKRNAYEGKTSKEIVKFFNDKAKEMVGRIQKNTNERAVENSRHKLIAANSMYCITQTILLKKRSVIEQNSGNQVFDMLTCMIADILVACLTNLPRVIAIKCHESVIEKRENSVEAAAELVGSWREIINNIQKREWPDMDPNKMTCVEEWRNYLNAELP